MIAKLKPLFSTIECQQKQTNRIENYYIFSNSVKGPALSRRSVTAPARLKDTPAESEASIGGSKSLKAQHQQPGMPFSAPCDTRDYPRLQWTKGSPFGKRR
ncbi:hypothetical protein CDAR_603291 [Caerostris darwini]|uniref:Uncharacterized protein n=1 Tax=Caerostris darwini TaxID=1538125 RepID=A0AAV4M4A4_9ARAC|nr:hypothetical protein CDAR_603291 [Caerostris darwini]